MRVFLLFFFIKATRWKTMQNLISKSELRIHLLCCASSFIILSSFDMSFLLDFRDGWLVGRLAVDMEMGGWEEDGEFIQVPMLSVLLFAQQITSWLLFLHLFHAKALLYGKNIFLTKKKSSSTYFLFSFAQNQSQWIMIKFSNFLKSQREVGSKEISCPDIFLRIPTSDPY